MNTRTAKRQCAWWKRAQILTQRTLPAKLPSTSASRAYTNTNYVCMKHTYVYKTVWCLSFFLFLFRCAMHGHKTVWCVSTLMLLGADPSVVDGEVLFPYLFYLFLFFWCLSAMMLLGADPSIVDSVGFRLLGFKFRLWGLGFSMRVTHTYSPTSPHTYNIRYINTLTHII